MAKTVRAESELVYRRCASACRFARVGHGDYRRLLKEVSFHLTFVGVRKIVDEIVASAVGDENVVVVGHSLGSVVSYNVLRARSAQPPGSAFITVGSPLGIDGIRSKLARPLDSERFKVEPRVENYAGVRNFTANRHGIAGYLSDPFVAARIVKALGS